MDGNKNCDKSSQFLFCQPLAPILPKPLYLFLMLRFISVQKLDIVCFLSPFLIGSGKLTEQHIFLFDGVQPGIVIGYNAGEEDRGQPKTEHDNPEPSTDVWRSKERPQVIVRHTKEQVTGHVLPESWANWLGEYSGVGATLPNHRSYGCFHYILVDDCHSWGGWLFLDLKESRGQVHRFTMKKHKAGIRTDILGLGSPPFEFLSHQKGYYTPTKSSALRLMTSG